IFHKRGKKNGKFSVRYIVLFLEIKMNQSKIDFLFV
ncbi:NSUN6 isoform 1, partial [Pan troglodytes]